MPVRKVKGLLVSGNPSPDVRGKYQDRKYTRSSHAGRIQKDGRCYRFLDYLYGTGGWVKRQQLDEECLIPWGMQGTQQFSEWRDKGYFMAMKTGRYVYYRITTKGINALKTAYTLPKKRILTLAEQMAYLEGKVGDDVKFNNNDNPLGGFVQP